MVKKKRNHPDLNDKLERPWCYYCERDFDDLKILISHQKAKHFKCERCGRRLNTAGGLSVHLNQVHKETLTAVENALPNRAGLDVEIFGMEGIPEDAIASYQYNVATKYYADQQNRAAATGNPVGGFGGSAVGNASKKPKLETPEELRKRLAEHKARKAAQAAAEAAGTTSGDVTPMSARQETQSPAIGQNPAGFPPAGSPPFGAPPQHFSAPPGAQPYGQPPFSQGPPQHGFPPQAQFPPQSPFPQQPGYAPPPAQQFGGNPYGPPAQFPPGGAYQPPYLGGPPHSYGAASPLADFNGGPPRYASPGNGINHQRQGSLPAPPSLPQKPVSNVPHVNSFQLQQMHQGQAPPAQGATGADGKVRPSSAFDESVDELISNAAKNADESSKATPQTDSAAGTEKKSKREKDKNVKFVFYDQTVSPEEKMAALPRYAFVPAHKDAMMLDVPEGAVTGAVGVH